MLRTFQMPLVYEPLTNFRPMEFSIKLHTIKSGWSIIYIEGSWVRISKKILYFFPLKIDLVFSSSADPDEMLHYTAFHLGLHGLPKYLFRGFQSTKATFYILTIIFDKVCMSCSEKAIVKA